MEVVDASLQSTGEGLDELQMKLVLEL